MSTEISFFHIISIIIAFLSLSLACFLFLLKSKYNKANWYLGWLILTYSSFFLPGFFDALGILDKASFVIRLNFFAGVLTGPLTYLYCKSSTQVEPLRVKNIAFHFLPFLAALLYFFPFFLKTSAEKIAVYQHVIKTGKAPEPQLIIIGMGIYTIVYTVLSIKIVFKHIQHIKNTRSTIDLSFHRWLFFLSCSLLMPILVVILITVTSSSLISVPSSLLIIATFIITIYVTLILKPKFFHYFPHPMNNNEIASHQKPKYQNSKLQERQKSDYQKRIVQLMEEKKPFLNPELTIAEFSEQLNIPPYHISQIINQELGCNFLDFVNKYRIEESKKKLQDSSLNHYTILTIAFDSGFNSKTAFYSAFKKNVGLTPSQFRKTTLNG